MHSGRTAAAALRVALLASTTFAGLMPAAAGAQVRQVARTLTESADLLTIPVPTFNLQAERSPFGLVAITTGVGVDALGGNDQLTLTGTSQVSGRADPFRNYLNLPVIGFGDILAAPRNALSMIGLDAGAGNDLVTASGTLSVSAVGTYNQFRFDVANPGFPQVLDGVSLDSQFTVAATGLAGGSGANTLVNSGVLSSSAEANGDRQAIKFNAADLGGSAQNLLTTAEASGLASAGGSGDTLTNTAGASLLVNATSDVTSVDISASGMTLTSPSNAAIAKSVAVAMRGGTGADLLTNAGAASVQSKAVTTEVGITVSANTISLPDQVIPENPVESSAIATALGLVGGAGADRLVNSGLLSLSADVKHTTVGITISDRVFDASAIDVFLEVEDTPGEPTGGAVARAAGLVGEGNDRLENSGIILASAKTLVSNAAVDIAAPLNSLSGQGDTAAGKVLDAISFGVSNGASASTRAFAEGMTAGNGYDRLTNTGTISSISDATAQTGQIGIDVLGFISDQAGGDGGGGGGARAAASA